MGWAFWRKRSPALRRALPDDVGLPTRSPAPASRSVSDDDAYDDPAATSSSHPAARASGATPADHPSPVYELPLTAPAPEVDRTALAAAGADLARVVSARLDGSPPGTHTTDDRTLAVAATGALAARLPALSGVDTAVDEPADELLHAYAELLVNRAQSRTNGDREDLLAVAHLAAASAAVDAAADPALLLLAGVPAEVQLRAATLLLAQTADDGAGAPDRLAAEVRDLFQG